MSFQDRKIETTVKRYPQLQNPQIIIHYNKSAGAVLKIDTKMLELQPIR